MGDAVNKPAHYNQGPIECIDAMKIVLTQEEFRGYLKGNVFKYLWREKDKNGNEDLRKGKDYFDWLIELVEKSEAEQLAAGEVAVEVTGEFKPPDGWRVLQNGELLRKGDKRWNNYISWDLEAQYIGINASNAFTTKFIRRNRFEVGEKVVYTIDNTIWTLKSEIDDGLRFPKSAWVTRVTGIGKMSQRTCVNHLAPYIEEAT